MYGTDLASIKVCWTFMEVLWPDSYDSWFVRDIKGLKKDEFMVRPDRAALNFTCDLIRTKHERAVHLLEQ